MLVLKLLASFVMTALKKDMKNWDLEKVQKKPVHFITKPEKLPQNQVKCKIKKDGRTAARK